MSVSNDVVTSGSVREGEPNAILIGVNERSIYAIVC